MRVNKTLNSSFLISTLLLLLISVASAAMISEAESSQEQDESRQIINDAEDIFSPREILPSEHDGVAHQSREILNMRLQTPQRTIVLSPTEKRQRDLIPEESSKDVISVEETQCHYAQTEYTLASTFNCEEGIAAVDDKETPLLAGRGKKYASIETTFVIPEINRKTTLRLVHDVKYPTQQDASIYYRDPITEVWKPLCHNIKEGVEDCDVTSAASTDKATFRIEGYSREGPALWSVNSISLIQEQTTQPPPSPPVVLTLANVPFITTALQPPTSTGGEPQVIFSISSPVIKSSGTQTLSASTTISPEGVPAQGENFQAGTDNANEPSPITGAAVGNFLTQNKAGFGLLLLFIALVGTMAYRASRQKRRVH